MLYLSSPGGKNGLNHRNSCQKFRQKPTLFALLISLLFAPPVFAADIVYDGTNTGMLRPNPEVSNNTANSLFPGSNGFSNNTVLVSGGTLTNVYGGVSNNYNPNLNDVGTGAEDVSNNQVTISGSANISSTIYGGRTKTGNASDNNVSIEGGTGTPSVYGGYSESGLAMRNTVSVSGTTGTVTGGNGSGGSTYNGVTVNAGSATGNIYGGFSFNLGNSTNNTVLFMGNSASTIYGGASERGAVNENSVTITNGSVSKVYGAYVSSSLGTENVTANTVMITGGTIGEVAGAYIPSGTGSAIRNEVTVAGGTITGDLYGGRVSRGDASQNKITISGNDTRVSTYVVAGHAASGSAYDNEVTANGGTINTIRGGYATGGAQNNSVIINGGKITTIQGGIVPSGSNNSTNNEVTVHGGEVRDITGGTAVNGNSTGNIVTLDGGKITSTVYGGSSSTGTISDNTVIVKNTPDLTTATLYGGYTQNGTIVNNTFQIWSTGLTANNIGNFDNYQFILPSSVQSGDTVLNLTNSSGTNASYAKVGVAVASGGAPTLQPGDRVTLLHNTSGVDSSGVTQTSLTGMQGVTLEYDFELESGADYLDAVLKKIGLAPGTGIFNSGRLATLGFLNQGTDFALDQDMECARRPDGTLDKICVYGAVSGHDLHYDIGGNNARAKTTGSHWLVGIKGKLNQAKENDIFGSAFVEAGWGNIDEHSYWAKGHGDTHYYGLGLTARFRQNEGTFKGIYSEANIKAGRTSTNFTSNLRDASGTYAGYDKGATYYGAGIGVGYLWALNQNYNLDISARYQWMHLKGFNAAIVGDPYHFDDLDSHRTRIGGRLNYTSDPQFTPYIGLAWEHEFNGKAHGTAYGYDLEEASLKGDTGVGEIGVRFSPSAKSPWTIDASIFGYVGQREGVAGNLVVNYSF
ncbi:Autotransporter beta-domain protein [Oxalobacter formigenes]|nr:Autotransporter beta-domain protein [Oxalobacter formigenes]